MRARIFGDASQRSTKCLCYAIVHVLGVCARARERELVRACVVAFFCACQKINVSVLCAYACVCVCAPAHVCVNECNVRGTCPGRRILPDAFATQR